MQIEAKQERPDPREGLTRLALAVWMAATAIGASYLLAGHWVELPVSNDPQSAIASALAEHRNGPDQWLAVHVLYEDCGCSQGVLHRLLDEGPPAGATERIVFVGQDDGFADEALARGYEVETLTPRELSARYRVQAAPLYLVLSPEDELAYVGGYTSRKRGPEPKHRQILAELRAGRDVEPFPVLGCAVSASLREAVDPLGLR